MKKEFRVTIIGRQNVGKSTLFNLFIKKRVAITEDSPGVTRDILEVRIDDTSFRSPFLLCDAPGLDIEDESELSQAILNHAKEYLLKSDLILHIIDIRDIRKYDQDLIDFLRTDDLSKIPNITVANKVDTFQDEDMEMVYRLGASEVIPISAKGRKNINLLKNKIDFYLPDVPHEDLPPYDVSFCIVGKPNAGKSSILNKVLGYNRALVSSVAGTTRDPVDSNIVYYGKNIRIVDTAGIRKKSKSAEEIEFYSYTRTWNTIEESQIVVLVIDSSKGIGEFDKKILNDLGKLGKPCILVFNKWDLIPDKESNTMKDYIQKQASYFPPIKDFPMYFISAQTGQRIGQVLESVVKIHEKINTRVTTHKLINKVKDWQKDRSFYGNAKRPPKVMYATQVSTSPWKIIFFVNDVELFTSSVKRFFEKKFREEYDLIGIPIQIDIKPRSEK
jgi:GTP-binding protein